MNKRKPVQESTNAVVLLIRDHREVEAAFNEFEGLGNRAFVAKKKLSEQICMDLMKHMVAEERIFYPAIKKATKDGADLVNEAIVEHAAAKSLIKEIKAMSSEDELFDSKVHVLSEQIAHHVQEEESEIFPAAEKSDLDLDDLGRQIEECKDQLTTASA